MNRPFAGSHLLLVLLIGSLSAVGLSADSRKQIPGQDVTEEEAKAWEEQLKTFPDNRVLREKLIGYYFRARLDSRKPELEERREQHIFWLIEHHSESEVAGSPEAGLDPMGSSGSTEGYQRGRQLWLEQTEKHRDNPRVLRNAAHYFFLADRKLARDLLERAADLDPTDFQTSAALAQSYMLDRIRTESPEEKRLLAQKALAVWERALPIMKIEMRSFALGDAATAAFEAEDLAKAEQYARELLQSNKEPGGGWNYGNAVHKGNIILGRIALRRGDISSARQHLVAAGETPGSPQLNSFGPNMTLAKELLEKGQRDVVVSYLESCAKFWKMGGDRIKEWIADVKAGRMPDFGPNLLY